MRLVRYNPLNTPAIFRNAFEDFFTDPVLKAKTDTSWQPAVDIRNGDDIVELAVDLPGINKEDIKVNIEDKILTISGERTLGDESDKEEYYRRERKTGTFKRCFTLSDGILTDEVTAEYTDGVLRVTLKKDLVKEAIKQITIN